VIPPPLPREHGAWAWLLLPLVAGGAAAGGANAPFILLAAGSLAAFVVRASLELASRRLAHRRVYLVWAGLYTAVALLALAPLLAYYHRWALLPIGATGSAITLPVLLFRELRYRWRAQGELLVVASLALLAPAAYHAATGDFDGRAAALWIPPALYGAGSVFYIRMLFEQRRPTTSAANGGARSSAALYLAVLWSVIVPAALLGALPTLVLVAFLPFTVKAALALARRTAVDDVRRTGIGEVLHATLFAALLTTAHAVG
jgi:hypothetical protein